MRTLNQWWIHELQIYSRTPASYHWTDVEVGPNLRYGHYTPNFPFSLRTCDNQLAIMRDKWLARLRTCWAFNPMDRPTVWDMKHMLYFPASVDDNRNDEYGYTLGTDDDCSHDSCEDNAYVHFSFLTTCSSSNFKPMILAYQLLLDSQILEIGRLLWTRTRTTAWARMRTTLLCRPCNNISFRLSRSWPLCRNATLFTYLYMLRSHRTNISWRTWIRMSKWVKDIANQIRIQVINNDWWRS